MTDQSFYLAQAAMCEQAAADAELPNQREKFTAARKAWLALAHQVEDMRQSRLAARK